jgi:hypothetical protein
VAGRWTAGLDPAELVTRLEGRETSVVVVGTGVQELFGDLGELEGFLRMPSRQPLKQRRLSAGRWTGIAARLVGTFRRASGAESLLDR